MAIGIITAGGYGLRIGAPISKVEIEILGKPMLNFSLQAFQSAGSIESMILVVPEDRLERWSKPRLLGGGFDKVTATVAGGNTRQESVFNALEVITSSGGVVIVHDGARPMVTAEMIDGMVDIPAGVDGIVTAVRVTDTVKEVEGRTVKRTLRREELVAVQTPQSFRVDALREAHRLAREQGYSGTDDASLVERAGGVVRTTEGDPENIKVTFPLDLELAEAVLTGRRNV